MANRRRKKPKAGAERAAPPPTLIHPQQDVPGAFAFELVRIPGETERYTRRARRIDADAVDRWRARGYLTQRQHEASKRYEADFERCGFQAKIVGSYGQGSGGGSGPNYGGLLAANNRQIDARQFFRDARAALPDAHRLLFEGAVLHGVPGRDLGVGPRRGGREAAKYTILVVAMVADVLADWYRLADAPSVAPVLVEALRAERAEAAHANDCGCLAHAA